ncbi:ABC transporter permease [bacterium]|nr:ABC transporter permease [bacterium]
MLIWEIITVALRGMWANRFRTFLTMFGIIVGVASVITLVAVTQGLNQKIIDDFDKLGATRMGVFINHWRSRSKIPPNERLTLEDRDNIRRDCSAVRYVSAIAEFRSDVRQGSKELTETQCVGSDAEIFDIFNVSFAEGERFAPESSLLRERICILGATTKENLFFLDRAIGRLVRLGGRNFRVVGVLNSAGDEQIDGMIILPFFTAYEWIPRNEQNLGIEMAAVSLRHVPLAVRQVEEAVYAGHPHIPVDPDAEEFEKPIRVWNMNEWRERAKAESKQITVLLLVMGSLSLFIGGIGLMNIMLFSVKERTREIGLRKALGADSRSILAQFISESMMICIGGGILGTGMSFVLCRLIARLPEEARFPDPLITQDAIIIAVAVTFMTGVFFGVWPASQAARLNPIEALRYE